MYTLLKFLSTKNLLPIQQCSFYVSKKWCSNISQKLSILPKGPGLEYFIAKHQGTKPINYEKTENIPYLSESDLNGNGRKVYFEVQGCQMNTNDTEIVWSVLKSKGYERTNNLYESDIVLLVTCAIRDSAESKIWKRVRELKGMRKGGLKYKVGLLGCMAERLKTKVVEIDKSIDLVAGPDSYKDLPRLLALLTHDIKAVNVLLSIDETYADIMPVRLNENSVSAYISIMRGCDNMCTYCIVPFTRGKERSRPLTSILDEVKMLSDQGVKQITLLGQNVNSYRDTSTSHYGLNCDKTVLSSEFSTVYKPKIGGLRFDVLLDKVSQIDPEMRIRFTSPHPKDFPDQVLQLIAERKNICNSIHLPLQSGSNSVLERMRRGYTREAYLKLVDHMRNILPDVAITTDIICGFCGETEKDHQDTLNLMKAVRYNFVYMYPYSLRERTTAHRRYVDNLCPQEKQKRVLEVGALFREIAKEINMKQIGQLQLVLVEGRSRRSESFLAGRNDGNCKVIIPDMEIPVGPNAKDIKRINVGDYVTVLISNASSQVLTGVPQYHTTLRNFALS